MNYYHSSTEFKGGLITRIGTKVTSRNDLCKKGVIIDTAPFKDTYMILVQYKDGKQEWMYPWDVFDTEY